MEGTAVTELNFQSCTFSSSLTFSTEESAAMMANAFARNTSVVSISVEMPLDVALTTALLLALPTSSTLRNLSFLCGNNAGHLSALFLALGKNTGLTVNVSGVMDGSLCAVIKDALESKTLELENVPLCDDNTDLWCRTLSFLRNDTAIKSLAVDMELGVTESCLSAFRIGIVAMLQEHASLESLCFRSCNEIKGNAEDYFVLVAARSNTTKRSTLSVYYIPMKFSS